MLHFSEIQKITLPIFALIGSLTYAISTTTSNIIVNTDTNYSVSVPITYYLSTDLINVDTSTVNYSTPKITPKQYVCNEKMKNKISEFILLNKPITANITPSEADSYAECIIKESITNGIDPYYQTSIIYTESRFNKSAKHGLPYVYGLCGINSKVWSEYLKDNDIIHKNSDLSNPYTNIKASVAILSYYMTTSKSTKEAITKYKGYCDVGRVRANEVIKVALLLKKNKAIQIV